jgi:hypothetical protein
MKKTVTDIIQIRIASITPHVTAAYRKIVCFVIVRSIGWIVKEILQPFQTA